MSISKDMLAVGTQEENSATTEINGNETDNNALAADTVYMFVRRDTTLTQQSYIKASNTGGSDYFGNEVSLSGYMLAVGAFAEDSATIGINGNQVDNSATTSGAVYVFR